MISRSMPHLHSPAMHAFDSEEKFAAAGPAATAVLKHRDTDPEIAAGPWGFDRGTVSSNGLSRAWGEFSHVAVANDFERDTLSVVAAEDGVGGWNVTHTVKRARRS